MAELHNSIEIAEIGRTEGLGHVINISGLNFNISYMLDHNNIIARKDLLIRDLVTYYLTGIGGVTLCILGMIGNFLSILVLSRKSMKSSTFCYLLALSCCDFMALLCTSILLGNDLQLQEKQTQLLNNGLFNYIFPYLNPLACTFQVISIWLTLAFTVDRYIMICHPFKAKSLCLISRARKIIAFLYAAGFAYNIPKFFEYKTEVITIFHPLKGYNISFSVCDLTDFGRSHVFKQLYHFWFYIIVVCGIPFLTLSVLNSCLINAVVNSRKLTRKYSSVKVHEKKNDTTIMLICVVLIFFICQMPALVSRTIWAIQNNENEFMKTPLFTLNEIANILVVLNSTINIIPYYYFSVRYRRVFLNLFCCCLPCSHQPIQTIKRYSFTSSRYKTYGTTSPDYSRKSSVISRQSLHISKQSSDNGVKISKNLYQSDLKQKMRDRVKSERGRKKSVIIDVFGDCHTADSYRNLKGSTVGKDDYRLIKYTFLKKARSVSNS